MADNCCLPVKTLKKLNNLDAMLALAAFSCQHEEGFTAGPAPADREYDKMM